MVSYETRGRWAALFRINGCRYGIFITQLDALTLRHSSAAADYILCRLTSVRLVLTVPTEQRSSGSLTTRHRALPRLPALLSWFTNRNLQVP
jgi:hypothetical protein